MIQFQSRFRPELPAAPQGNHRPQDYPRIRATSPEALRPWPAFPAAILARMLGIHINVAAAWPRASAGDWAAYAETVALPDRLQPACQKIPGRSPGGGVGSGPGCS
jgi:hypothetical protein